jgi:two-component system phosphate regulon sensor histidine kinase PhoR
LWFAYGLLAKFSQESPTFTNVKYKPGFFDGWLLALIVSICITIPCLVLLYHANNLSHSALVPVGVVVFWVAFLIVFAFLEFVVLREAKRIYKITQKKKKKKDKDGEQSLLEVEQPGLFNPMRRVYEEVSQFTTTKEEEIEELKRMEAFRREFIANVSHELKTPLFAAQGFIHTLIDGAANDATVRTRFLNKAAKSLDGLENLVQDLLMLSQIETGEIKMRMETHDLCELAKDVAEELEEPAQKKNITLKVDEPKKKAVALADAKWIRQVLTNLIYNAINYTPEGGSVTVKFEFTKKSVYVIVKDTGMGIPAEHLPRIFERFYRVDKSRSRERGGTGLGLAIVKHILEGHHTKAEVESEEGKGSEFSFKLERVKQEE